MSSDFFKCILVPHVSWVVKQFRATKQRFWINSRNMSRPFQVYWQVRNTIKCE